MKTLFDKTTREELITRINSVDENSTAQWGKMTLYQMLKHCMLWEEMLLGKTLYKQSLLGRIVGKFALKDMLKDEPIKRNLPTVPSFKVTGNGDVAAAKTEWIGLLNEHFSVN
jgi:SNF2 family DNA or RNA helicase